MLNAEGSRRLLKLPGLRAHAPADHGEEQVQRLLEGVSNVFLGEEQRILHPALQAGLVLWQRLILLQQKNGASVEYLSQPLIETGHIRDPCLWGISITMRKPWLW